MLWQQSAGLFIAIYTSSANPHFRAVFHESDETAIRTITTFPRNSNLSNINITIEMWIFLNEKEIQLVVLRTQVVAVEGILGGVALEIAVSSCPNTFSPWSPSSSLCCSCWRSRRVQTTQFVRNLEITHHIFFKELYYDSISSARRTDPSLLNVRCYNSIIIIIIRKRNCYFFQTNSIVNGCDPPSPPTPTPLPPLTSPPAPPPLTGIVAGRSIEVGPPPKLKVSHSIEKWRPPCHQMPTLRPIL